MIDDGQGKPEREGQTFKLRRGDVVRTSGPAHVEALGDGRIRVYADGEIEHQKRKDEKPESQ